MNRVQQMASVTEFHYLYNALLNKIILICRLYIITVAYSPSLIIIKMAVYLRALNVRVRRLATIVIFERTSDSLCSHQVVGVSDSLHWDVRGCINSRENYADGNLCRVNYGSWI